MRKRLAKAAKNIKSETNREYYETVRDILEHPVVRKMSEFKHHYGTSCYRHCLNVSYMNFIICKKLHLDARAAARAGMLHDLFLYDWHKPHGRWHGFKHPAIALKNATRDFKLTEIEKNLIVRHMFPLVPIPPKNIEGGIVCMVDKWCSLKETFCSDIYKKDGMVQQIIKIVEIKLREEETRESTVNISQRHVVL